MSSQMRFAADENFNNDILRGVLRRMPEFDVIRIQDTDVYEADDPTVLHWIIKTSRYLLTHDTRTMAFHAGQIMKKGKTLPGIFVINDNLPIGQVIEELLVIAGASEPSEWENRIFFLPI